MADGIDSVNTEIGLSFRQDAAQRIGKWRRELPFTVYKKLTNWKLLVVVATCIAFIWPSTYGRVVGWLPKSYYYVGTIKNRPEGQKILGWQIDLNAVDNAPRAQRLDRFEKVTDSVARLGKDGYVPGRSQADGRSQEDFGRQWNAGKCLYIRDTKIVSVYSDAHDDVYASNISLRDQKTKFMESSCSFVTKDTCKELRKDDPRAVCKPDPDSKQCPAFTLWLHGTPVPCFLF